jgi:alanine racemase
MRPRPAADAGVLLASTRSTRAIVDLARLERNWRRLRAVHARGCVMTVLKANAYGHGMVPVARFLQGLGQERFAVALLDEALALRRAGITGRILVLGPPEPGSLPLYGPQRIEATLPSVEHLREAIHVARSAPLEVHLKVDSGMGRIGLRPDALEDARALLRALPQGGGLKVRGIFSHFAEAERLASPVTDAQHAAYERACAALTEALPGPAPERHLANSAGLLRDRRFHYDFARVGFALWAPPRFDPPGQAPPTAADQEQVLTLRSAVSYVKTTGEGERIGYGGTYQSHAGEVIATLPVGHGDGYFRNLGNRARVLLRGQRRAVVGRVSMDQCTVSLGQDACAVGDEAILLGGHPEGITVAELAAWAGTIDYEVFTHLAARVPRDYVYDGQPVPEP